MTIPTYGTPLPGKQLPEHIEMKSFFNRLRKEYPDTWGAIALHVRNEDRSASARQMVKIKSEGGFI